WENLCLSASPEGVEVVGFKVDSLKRYEGQRLSQIARTLGKTWPETIIDLTLAEEDRLGQLLFIASDSNVALQFRQPWLKFGTDAAGLDPDSMKGRMTHPRAYGNYPRILGRFVREQKVLTLEDAIRKMTGAVWGRLAPGSRVIESDIAERLGVSRTPVRSALHRLQQEGYIVGVGRGSEQRLTVAPLTQDDARDLFAIIGAIEGLAAQHAAGQA